MIHICHSLYYYLIIVIVTSVAEVKSLDIPCARKKVESGYVCVCNATYCDTLERPTPLDAQHYMLYSTSDTTPGFTSQIGTFQNQTTELPVSDITITIDSSVKYQIMNGIGGSFSDAFGINLRNLSSGARENLLRSYFSNEGIEYSLARVPIGGTDFSLYAYTYDDFPGDEELSHFHLNEADYNYKIPYILRAQELSKREIKLMASPWTGPVWMKENNKYPPGYLLPKYYQLYADYLMKFFDAYKENNVTFWSMTTGNEVVGALYAADKLYSFNNMMFLPQHHRIWYKNNLGPTLQKSQHSSVKVITLDDQRMFINWWIDRIMVDTEAAKLISGIALHGYLDNRGSPKMLDVAHDKYPNLFIINTEFCVIPSVSVGGPNVDPGAWNRGALYAQNIIENLNHWSVGYIDWNMALNMQGGPYYSTVGNDAVIVVNAENDEFYKNPMFYVLGHFSKFISHGSVRIQSTSNNEQIQHLATKNTDGSTSVFLHNPSSQERHILIKKDVNDGSFALLTVQANSMNTLVYW